MGGLGLRTWDSSERHRIKKHYIEGSLMGTKEANVRNDASAVAPINKVSPAASTS